MTDTQVQEGNKLIAEFMGAYRPHNEQNPYEKTFLYKDGERWVQLDALKYHTSWDWLMPVVEKIWNISQELDGLYTEESEFYKSFYALTIHNLYISSKIENVWQACIQFIQWYNQTNSK